MLPLGVGGAFYINLDHRTDRRAEIEAELDRIGIPCERFPAIKYSPGIVGCGYSHLAVLKEARARGYKSVLIFEDDFQFLVNKETFWSIMSGIERDLSGSYDVIMLAYNLQNAGPQHSEHLMKADGAQTTSAYIIHSRMYDTLINLWEMAVERLIQTGEHWVWALDQIWKTLQPKSEWFTTKVRIGLQRPSFSDIGQKFVDNQC
jgi:GR25 family glycosyltransferase involved in LPS biosynthesis